MIQFFLIDHIIATGLVTTIVAIALKVWIIYHDTSHPLYRGCLHPNASVRKWVEDNTPFIDTYCPDCGYHDHGHVHGDVEGWADEN